MQYLEFEKPLADIEGKAEELRAMAKSGGGVDMSKEAEALDRKADAALRDLYKTLSAWQKCQVARHPDRLCTIAEIAETNAGVKVKLHNKVAALEQLAKHVGLYQDRASPSAADAVIFYLPDNGR